MLGKILSTRFAEARNSIIFSILQYLTEEGNTEIRNKPKLEEGEIFYKGIDLNWDSSFGTILSVSKIKREPYYANSLIITYKTKDNNIISEGSEVFSMDELWELILAIECYDRKIESR